MLPACSCSCLCLRHSVKYFYKSKENHTFNKTTSIKRNLGNIYRTKYEDGLEKVYAHGARDVDSEMVALAQVTATRGRIRCCDTPTWIIAQKWLHFRPSRLFGKRLCLFCGLLSLRMTHDYACLPNTANEITNRIYAFMCHETWNERLRRRTLDEKAPFCIKYSIVEPDFFVSALYCILHCVSVHSQHIQFHRVSC